jgi:hypothetical protein
MARPVVSQAAESLYAILLPVAFADEQLDWPLLRYCETLAGTLQEVNDYTASENGYPPWSVIVDVDRAPFKALPWLGQLVGLRMPVRLVTETDAQYETRIRDYIRQPPGFRRGTPSDLIEAAQLHLTGTKTVILRERYGGAYRLEILTKAGETPNSDYVLRALLARKPAGLVLTYTLLAGQDYQILYTDHATYQIMFTTYVSYQGVYLDQPGT